jgi:hypothetical protein
MNALRIMMLSPLTVGMNGLRQAAVVVFDIWQRINMTVPGACLFPAAESAATQ